ncbi:MAG: CBS domain-containing protein [Methylophilus sp.]|uniref:CBS domain-containing protein n=1 Tax=Methylophilus sp. TaxID=29541 RepID=UPI003FA166E4
MIINQVMSKDVLIAAPDETLKFAALIMEQHDYDALPICEHNRLIGMLSVSDIAVKALANGLSLDEIKISQCMTFEAQYVFSDQSTEHAIQFMAEHQLRRLLVLDRGYHLVGIVSLDDLAITNKIKGIFAVKQQLTSMAC